MSNLEVDPDLARQILAGAAAAGESVEAYLNRIVNRVRDLQEDTRPTDLDQAATDRSVHGDATEEMKGFDRPELRFQRLASRWRDETSHLSSYTERVLHPAYQEIIGMGAVAVPLLLGELKQRCGHWFWALRAITGENPVPPSDAGKVRMMTEHWLRWGKERGYLK